MIVSPSAIRLRVSRRTTGDPFVALIVGMLLCALPLEAQQSGEGPTADKQTMQMLLQRIEQLETSQKQLLDEVARLQKEIRPGAAPVAAMAPPTSPRTETPSGGNYAEQGEMAEPERMDVNRTLLNIRGFGDFGLYGGNQKKQVTSFSLGEINLFITSNMSERFKFLTETVFEQSQANNFGVELERMLLEYSFNDYLKLSAGRYHTAIGYYNTAFHHSTWLQTTTGRPFLFAFEDEGGILPIHNVGIVASGQIPSGDLGLHYVAEVGAGRASDPQAQPVQNFIDEDNHKAVDVEIFAQPDAVQGLNTGFSVYRDVRFPPGLPRTGETIVDGYIVLVRPRFEWLNEGLVIRHTPQGMRVFDTPGFYSQISERFGSYRPYFRYQYVNANNSEPIFPQVGLRTGPSVGLRFDASASVALKLQYDYTELRKQQGVSELGLQVGFTF
jgi:hypothetical protein